MRAAKSARSWSEIVLFSIFLGIWTAFLGWLIYQYTYEMAIRAQVSTWSATHATLVDVRVIEDRARRGGRIYLATATYAYVVHQQTYIGHRVGISTKADRDREWHENECARLRSALSSGQPVTVWFDPDQPQQSILNRDPRWLYVLFPGLFVCLWLSSWVILIHAERGAELNKRTRSWASVVVTFSGSALCFTIPFVLWGWELGTWWAAPMISLAVVVQGALIWLAVRFWRASASSPPVAKSLRTSRR